MKKILLILLPIEVAITMRDNDGALGLRLYISREGMQCGVKQQPVLFVVAWRQLFYSILLTNLIQKLMYLPHRVGRVPCLTSNKEL